MAQLVTEITTDLEPTVISIIKQIVASAKVDLSSQQESLVNTIMVQMKPVVTAAVNNALRTSSYQVSTPRMVRYHLIQIRTGKSGFSKIRIFRFFDFLSLKTLQYRCLWTRLDPTMSLVPVPRYCGTFSVLYGTFLVLNRTFSVQTPTIWVSMDSPGPT